MGTVTRIGRGPAGLPFSRMTLKDGRFFLSGQVAQNPETGRIDHPGCYEQSLTVLGNIRGILAEAGFAPEQVAKMTVFLTDMGQKDAFDRAFERVFSPVSLNFCATRLKMGTVSDGFTKITTVSC